MKWTQSTIQTFVSFVGAGATDEWLAIQYGVSEPAIRRARQRFAPFSVKQRTAPNPSYIDANQNPTHKNTVFDPNAPIWSVDPSTGEYTWIGSGPDPRVDTKTTTAFVDTMKEAYDKLIEACPGPLLPQTTVDPLVEKASAVPIEHGKIPLDVFDGDAWTKIGLVSDTHLCCKEERLDALNAQYDLFAREGVRDVFHGGNIVDGYIPRINGDSALRTSIDGQAIYCADNYPQREGITTHFITGDDHEGWWQKEGFNFGAYLQMVCERKNRFDLKYIGHVEADVELTCGGFINRMKIQHPGGGSAYARSYKGQKMVESFQGGEKPAILVQGHYHVSGYSFDRNVHIVGLPGFKDQDMFTRKKHLRCEIGGVILEFKMSSVTGAITRIRPEFNMFFDRGFYKTFLTSDGALRTTKTIICG